MYFHFELLFLVSCVVTFSSPTTYSPQIQKIIDAAQRDGIDLPSLPFASAAFESIERIQDPIQPPISLNGSKQARVDTHGHVIPDWYRSLVPFSGGNQATPNWTVEAHLKFMADNSIGHNIMSISTPGAGVYLGDERSTIGIARLLNEWCGAVIRTYPKAFSFYATLPLPYVEAAKKETSYARSHLGALGTILLSNNEAIYPGDALFAPFFAYLNTRSNKPEVVFIHPNAPVEKLNGTFISANPTAVPWGFVEVYFDTARAITSLTLAQTFQNLTNIRWHIAHGGGAWPSVEDRILNYYPDIKASARPFFNTRCWYDNAAAVFPDQVKGLLGYSVPPSQLVFGTDYPYMPPAYYAASIDRTLFASAITAQEKVDLFHKNVEALYRGAV